MTQREISIKVNGITFGEHSFRKLKNLRIDIADRLTVIAGHNGIGKSTILGLLTNTFGLTDKENYKSYFGESFYCSIERIVYLSLSEAQNSSSKAEHSPMVDCTYYGEQLIKRCALTQRKVWKRARVVPRTYGKDDIKVDVGADAKIPLPSIYLGVTRLASIGEANEKDVLTRPVEMDPDDATLITKFISSVISGSKLTQTATHQSIKGTRKKTIQPGYESHEALAVSMGQDSLASIATAFASFNKLKREMGDNYPGGLLVIDEVDVGFHPHAIERLAKALKKFSKSLNLQVITTSHSPKFIECIHPEGDGNKNAPDKVIYLIDTRHPRLADDQSLKAILNDMALVDEQPEKEQITKKEKTSVITYFEDAEAMQFFDELIGKSKKSELSRKYNISIKTIPLGIGGSNLIQLPIKDPVFKQRLLVVDGDTTVKDFNYKSGHILKLPCPKGSTGVNRSPENTIKNFLRSLIESDDIKLQNSLRNLNTTNPTTDKIENTFFSDGDGDSDNRVSSKKWWQDHWQEIQEWNVIQVWAKTQEEELNLFLSALEKELNLFSNEIIENQMQ
jgi:hypothetical protein